MMRHSFQVIILSVLLIVAAACVREPLPETTTSSDGRAQVAIGVRVPAPVATRAVDENGIDENGFIVFAFAHDDSAEDGEQELLWMLKSGDVNTNSNLDEYTETTAIKWRPGVYPSGYTADDTDGSTSYGTLYFESDVYADPIDILVVANADLSKITSESGASVYEIGDYTLTSGESTLAEVVEALSAFDYSAKELTGTYEDAPESDGDVYIPMAGRTTIEGGVGVGVTGTVSLRRSLAKVSVSFNYNDLSDAKFIPQTMKIKNVSEYATVYNPSSEDALLPEAEGETGVYDAVIDFGDYAETSDYPASVTATLYIAESAISSGDTHVTILVSGIYDSEGVYDADTEDWKDYTGEWPETARTAWYRLDFIPNESSQDDSGVDDDGNIKAELSEILRNHHYIFAAEDLSYMGSQTEELALDMAYPDNYPIHGGTGTWTLYVEDEDINSITVAYDRGDTEGGMPNYVGVSSTDLTIELPATLTGFESALSSPATHIKVVTNFKTWNVDDGIDQNDCAGIFTFSFVEGDENDEVYWLDESGNDETLYYPAHSGIMWIWADGDNVKSLYDESGNLIEGQTFSFYIVVGTVRKEITITVVAEVVAET